MNEQDLRAAIHKAMDERLSGIQADPCLEGKAKAFDKRKKAGGFHPSLRIVVLTAILLLSTIGVAYTAIRYWKLHDYYRSSGVQIPQDFESGFDQDLTQEFMGFRFHIRDAYMNGDTVEALVEISRVDGAPGVFLYDADEINMNKSIRMLHEDYPEDITIREYIEKTGLPVFCASSRFKQEGVLSGGSGDLWMEGECMMVYYTTTRDLRPSGGEITLEWEVNARDDQGVWHTASMPVTLPAGEIREWQPEDTGPLFLDGMEIRIKSIRAADNPLGLDIQIVYELKDEKPGDYEKILQYRFFPVHPDTLTVLPDIGKGLRFIYWKIPNTGVTEITWMARIDSSDLNTDTLALQLLPKDAQAGDPSAPAIRINRQ